VEEVGLVYFGERYLIPRLGRWASVDPLSVHAMGGGEAMNGYHYVGGNLLQARDPLGLAPRPASQSEAAPPSAASAAPSATDKPGAMLTPDAPSPEIAASLEVANRLIKHDALPGLGRPSHVLSPEQQPTEQDQGGQARVDEWRRQTLTEQERLLSLVDSVERGTATRRERRLLRRALRPLEIGRSESQQRQQYARVRAAVKIMHHNLLTRGAEYVSDTNIGSFRELTERESDQLRGKLVQNANARRYGGRLTRGVHYPDWAGEEYTGRTFVFADGTQQTVRHEPAHEPWGFHHNSPRPPFDDWEYPFIRANNWADVLRIVGE